MVSQPDQQELTFEQRCAAQRERDIAAALTRGDHRMAAVFRAIEYEQLSADESVALDRIIERAGSAADWEEPEAWKREFEREDPEGAEMFRWLDQHYGDWDIHLHRTPEEHPEEAEFLRRLDQEHPSAAQFFRSWHEELRQA